MVSKSLMENIIGPGVTLIQVERTLQDKEKEAENDLRGRTPPEILKVQKAHGDPSIFRPEKEPKTVQKESSSSYDNVPKITEPIYSPTYGEAYKQGWGEAKKDLKKRFKWLGKHLKKKRKVPFKRYENLDELVGKRFRMDPRTKAQLLVLAKEGPMPKKADIIKAAKYTAASPIPGSAVAASFGTKLARVRKEAKMQSTHQKLQQRKGHTYAATTLGIIAAGQLAKRRKKKKKKKKENSND